MLYAFADSRWWVQPFAYSPRTEIEEDGSWKAKIHLGTEYAAVLSRDDGPTAPFVDVLPATGKEVDAVAIVKGIEHPTLPPEDQVPGRTLRFSGLEWSVRTVPGDYGTKMNEYRSENVFVDGSGALHLRLTHNFRGWVCSEVHTVRTLGYGNYTLSISDTDRLEPAVMFSVFTFFERPTDGDHRELTIHLTRRGVASNTNAEISTQPSFVPTNFYHFNVPSGPLALGLNWRHDEADFSVGRGQTPATQPVVSWPFKTGVPIPDDTHLYINFCNYGYAPIAPTHDAEVVVKSFEFYP